MLVTIAPANGGYMVSMPSVLVEKKRPNLDKALQCAHALLTKVAARAGEQSGRDWRAAQ